MDTTTSVLINHLEESAATPEFRAAVEAYRRGEPQDRLALHGRPPKVKVERVLTKLLEELPDQPIERIELDAHSGCSNFTGTLRVAPGDAVYRFDWDCAWKARQVGYVVYGMPDQGRAAMEFGYDCFRVFERQG
jgi:hypothetical protein